MPFLHLIALFVGLVLVLAGCMAVLSCLASVMINLGYGQMRTAASQAGTSSFSLIVRTLASSFLSCLYTFATCFLSTKKGLHPCPGPESNGRPIVCIHGLYQNHRAWLVYQHWLRSAGFTRLYTWSYSSFGQDFDHLSQALSQDLVRLAREHPGKKMVLIGHSLGGLLIQSVLADPAVAKHTHMAVTLGTPHQGSVLASLALGKLGRSLKFEGELVRSLQTRKSQPEPAKVYIHPPLDTLVAPLSGLHPREPGWTEIETPPLGHVSLLFHRPTARRIEKYISDLR